MCSYYVAIETAGPLLHEPGEEEYSRRTSEGDPYPTPEPLTFTRYTLIPEWWYLEAEPLGSTGGGAS